MENIIRLKLEHAFSPLLLEIRDDSASHAGHGGFIAGKSTHFKIKIVSATFIDVSKIDRHRLVYATLAEELSTHIHALSLVLLAPDEAGQTSHAI